MKKILFLLFSVIFMANIAFAQGEYTDYSQLLNSTTMPSDSEIMSIIDKFEFTPEQKQQLFKETKKQIQEIFETKNAALLEQKVNEGKRALQENQLNVNNVMLPEVEKTDRNIEAQEPSKQNPVRYFSIVN